MEDDGLGDLNCSVCGTVMHPAGGGYLCRGCGWQLAAERVERPAGADDLPGVNG